MISMRIIEKEDDLSFLGRIKMTFYPKETKRLFARIFPFRIIAICEYFFLLLNGSDERWWNVGSLNLDNEEQKQNARLKFDLNEHWENEFMVRRMRSEVNYLVVN